MVTGVSQIGNGRIDPRAIEALSRDLLSAASVQATDQAAKLVKANAQLIAANVPQRVVEETSSLFDAFA